MPFEFKAKQKTQNNGFISHRGIIINIIQFFPTFTWNKK